MPEGGTDAAGDGMRWREWLGRAVLAAGFFGFLLLFMHLAGVLGRAVMPGLTSGDLIIPSLILELLPPFWAGVFVAGPLAAIMSTVDTMLLLVSASIIKDLYIRYRLKNDASRLSSGKIGRMSFCCTLAVGVLVFLASFDPPDLLVWINLFAFGGLEAVFLWPVVLGMYWKKANAAGAVCSMVAGVVCFMLLSIFNVPLGGVHAIVPTCVVSLLAFWLGNLRGSAVSDEVTKLFWED